MSLLGSARMSSLREKIDIEEAARLAAIEKAEKEAEEATKAESEKKKGRGLKGSKKKNI